MEFEKTCCLNEWTVGTCLLAQNGATARLSYSKLYCKQWRGIVCCNLKKKERALDGGAVILFVFAQQDSLDEKQSSRAENNPPTGAHADSPQHCFASSRSPAPAPFLLVLLSRPPRLLLLLVSGPSAGKHGYSENTKGTCQPPVQWRFYVAETAVVCGTE